MKKAIFVLLILAGTVGQSSAQDKEKFWIGGSFGAATDDEEGYIKRSVYSIQPEIGYAFSDRWAAGIRFGIEQSKIKYDETRAGSMMGSKTNNFNINPFVRYTCLKWKALNIFVDGGLRYGWGKENQTRFDNEDEEYYIRAKDNDYGLFIEPGVSLQISRSIALAGRINLFNLSYNRRNHDTNGDDNVVDRDNFDIGLNSPFYLGNFSLGFNVCF